MAVILRHETYGDIPFPEGTTDQELTQYLVKLEAAGGEQYGVGETIVDQMGRSFTSSLRTLGDLTGIRDDQDRLEDREREFQSRVQFEQNPASSVVGMLAGGILDPVTIPALALAPIKVASTVGTFALRGAAQGAAGGALEPVYESYGDSTVANIFAGTVLGGGLGAGIGKLLTLGKTPDVKANEVEAVSDDKSVLEVADAIDIAPVRTVGQAQEKILKDLEIEATGAPSKRQINFIDAKLNQAKQNLASIDNTLNKLKGSTAPVGKKVAAKSATKVLENRKVEAQQSIQQLEVQKAEGDVLRKAAVNLNKARNGKFSEIEGYSDRVNQASIPLARSPVAAAVRGQSPQPVQPAPIGSQQPSSEGNAALFRRLGLGRSAPRDPYAGTSSAGAATETMAVPRFQEEVSGVGSGQVQSDDKVAQQFMPRSQESATRRLVDGKVSGENRETINPIKMSQRAKDAIEAVQNKRAKGQTPTPNQLAEYNKAQEEMFILDEYTDTVAKIARTRGLDTYANRFGSTGRYNFDNITKGGAKFLRDNNIEDLDGMVRYIVDNPNKIFSSEETNGLTELLQEVDDKLLNTQLLIKHADRMTDAEVAVLHNDIDVYYGIQSWFKGQGSKVAGVMNARKLMYKNIADNREIKQLFAGVDC